MNKLCLIARLTGLLWLVFFIIPAICRADEEKIHADDPDWDEKVLKTYKIDTTDDGLTEYLRKCAALDSKLRKMDAVIRQLSSADFMLRDQAVADIVSLGPPALPRLEKELKNPDPEVGRRAQVCIDEIRGQAKKSRPQFDLHTRLIALRLVVRRQLPAVIDLMVESLIAVDPTLTTQIADVLLWAQDERAIPSYPTWRIRISAKEVQALRPKVKPIMDAIHEAGRSPDPVHREAVHNTLQRLGGPELPMLLEKVHKSKDSKSKIDTLEKLARLKYFRLMAREATPVLLEALKDDDASVRKTAAEKLGWMRLQAEKAVPALSAALGDGDVAVRVQAAIALGRLGPEACLAAPMLLQTIKARDGSLRDWSAYALGAIESSDPRVLAALHEALKDPEARRGAILGLGRIGPDAKSAIPALIEIFMDCAEKKGDFAASDTCSYVLTALSAMGSGSRDAVPFLVDLLEKRHHHTHDVLIALEGIGPQASPAVPTLLKLFQSKEGAAHKQRIVRTLGAIGPEAKSASPYLWAIVKDMKEDRMYRQLCAQAVGMIDPSNNDARLYLHREHERMFPSPKILEPEKQ
jgi:HEAT repeat protein